ncbi:MAG: hypothetical protein WCO56_00520 [Verrucomicrobiota bacterium]
MRKLSLNSLQLFGLAVAMFAVFGSQTAAAPLPFTAFSAGKADVIISQAGGDFLRIGTAVWGPKWAYSSFTGKNASETGITTGDLSAKIKGAGTPLRLSFKAARIAPNQLQLSYELKAEAGMEITLAAVDLAPGKCFEGREVIVEAQGKTTRVPYPFGRRPIDTQVSALRLTEASGSTTVIRFEPPCEVAADNSARIILAQDAVKAGVSKSLKLTVELPGATDWYASLAEMPEEPGMAAWYPWLATGDPGDSILGMQDWLEQPAGKHGRITRQDDSLLYHGQPIKLWGINLCYGACAPEKAMADKRAAFYRKYGINAVRLHKFADGAGWSGIQSKASCVEYDPQGLDLMDYQVAKFKAAGIYVKLSAHFGSLKLGPADRQYVPFMEEFGDAKGGRIETPHSGVHYSPDLQRVQILQMVNLLKHKNPHTGLTYAEDPAVAFIEIINEQSILFFTSMTPLKASATLRKQVGERFCQWLRQKYGSHDKLAQAWGQGSFDSFAADGFKPAGEHLDKNNILPLGNPWYWDPEQLSGSQASRKRRLLDTLEFLYTLECEFYDRYVKALREAGYQGEILSSNWQAGRAYSHFANLHADYRVGTIDRHNYFGGKTANASMLAHAGSGMLSSGMQQVADRPFMLSEWIHVVPSEFGVEGPAILGAYGMGLQGWDVSFMFQNRDTGNFAAKLGGDRWEVTAPQVLGIFPAVARQIHRGDVKQSDLTIVRHVHVPSLFEGRLSFDDKVAQGYDDKELDSSKVPAQTLAVARSVVDFTKTFTDTPAFDLKPYRQDGLLVSDTKQLRWHEAAGDGGGWFTMDTPGTKAVVGFASGRKHDLGCVTIEAQGNFAAIYLTARERDQSIETSHELILVATARARNTGMKFSPNGDRLLAPGAAPILMEPVKARISLRKPGAPKIYLLDHDGRLTDRTLPVVNGTCTIDGARDKTPYYLLKY